MFFFNLNIYKVFKSIIFLLCKLRQFFDYLINFSIIILNNFAKITNKILIKIDKINKNLNNLY